MLTITYNLKKRGNIVWNYDYVLCINTVTRRNKETDKVRRRFCKKLLGLPRYAVKSMAEMVEANDRRGMIWRVAKYCQRIIISDIQYPVKAVLWME
jgi:hypothetical protein